MLPNLKLQPLRIPASWLVSYNNGLYEIDPDPAIVPESDRWWIFKEGMLQMRHDATNRLLDLPSMIKVGWSVVGTSIDVLFSKSPRGDNACISQTLNATFANCQSELRVIKEHAWYSLDCEPWAISLVPAHHGEPEYLFDEGPFGFDIRVYENVTCLGHLERFGRLHYHDSPVAISLQRIVAAIAEDLLGSEPFACVAGGMGDSDRAVDMAYYQRATFSEVSQQLYESLGEPATSWPQLNKPEHSWALIGQV